MLYLKSLSIDKFKSFKHAELLFSKGFTCVIGPNGSGKSNICDALLFGLGENALRRLRVRKLETLINTSNIKGKTGLKKAYVKMVFSGDEEMTVIRMVRSDGKSQYRVNGKHMSRQEVLEIFAKHGIRADETSTILQGEINKVIDMNGKERRELIDIASGIKEFEYKKNEAMKELEKVSQKISEANVMLHERQNFLSELEFEKEAAEKYISMASRLKSLNYSALLSKKEEAESAQESEAKSMAILDSKKNEMAYKLEDAAKSAEQLDAEKQMLTKELAQSAQVSGATSSKLESIKTEMARNEIEAKSLSDSLQKEQKYAEEWLLEVSKSKQKVAQNREEMERASSRLGEITPEISKFDSRSENISKHAERLKQLGGSVEELERKESSLASAVSNMKMEAQIILSKKEAKEAECKEAEKQIETASKSISAFLSEQERMNKEAKEASDKIMRLESEVGKTRRELDKIDEELLKFREQKFIAQPRASPYEKIKEKFSSHSGFFGKASELCKYTDEYANAVEAAAGARFEYLVVDKIETANEIISYLKSNNSGRATFIPIENLRVQKDERKDPELMHVIDVISFDSRFESVFSYIFSNTYVIGNILEAKKHRIGQHRYVTVEGELVEQSGVVSGGSHSGSRKSAYLIEKSLNALSSRKEQLLIALQDLDTSLAAARKAGAYIEAQRGSTGSRLVELRSGLEKTKSLLEERNAEVKELADKLEGIKERVMEAEGRHAAVLAELDRGRSELSDLYAQLEESSAKEEGEGENDADINKLNGLRKEADGLKAKIAGLGKENELLVERIAETESKITKSKSSEKSIKEKIHDLEISLGMLDKSRKAIESEMAATSESSKKIYGRLTILEGKLSKLLSEKSQLASAVQGMETQLIEIKMRRNQIETKIADINAELAAYAEKPERISGMQIGEMEKEANVLSVKISEMGSVNMKAPEIFEERKRDVAEAKSKLDVLDSERQAVLRMIEEIESKKLQTFMNTLNDVSKNFIKLFSYIFTDQGALKLSNPKEPFNSDLDISITKGKTARNLDQLSGGEKSLVSLMLILSIHMCKPSQLYVFDEVDSALDKENSKKLSLLIKQMSSNAQYVVVSHNDSLIVNSDAAVGVVKTEGESKAIGVEVSSILQKR